MLDKATVMPLCKIMKCTCNPLSVKQFITIFSWSHVIEDSYVEKIYLEMTFQTVERKE